MQRNVFSESFINAHAILTVTYNKTACPQPKTVCLVLVLAEKVALLLLILIIIISLNDCAP
jgi:hypothetical protein